VLCKSILHFEDNSNAAIQHHEHEGKRPAQWRKIFVSASCSSHFVVEICYLRFPRFGWGFAALCLGVGISRGKPCRLARVAGRLQRTKISVKHKAAVLQYN
jgi:hypothetical protein